MKKRLTAFFAAVFLLFSLSEAADASSSTYRNQLGRIENEIYDAMASYLPQGYDSFSYEFSQRQPTHLPKRPTAVCKPRYPGLTKLFTGTTLRFLAGQIRCFLFRPILYCIRRPLYQWISL